MKEMTIAELANKICDELPGRWEIVIRLENGCGEVVLYDPLGEPLESSYDENLQEQVFQALKHAKDNDSNFDL